MKAVVEVQAYPLKRVISGPRQRQNFLRRHWLSAALLIGVMGLAAYAATLFYKAEVKLSHVRASRADLEEQLEDARQTNRRLQEDLTKATDDTHMELKAKAMGFAYPHETVFQSAKH